MGEGSILGPLHQVALASSDLERSIAFYRDQLGLSLVARFDPPGLAFFQLGHVRLLLERSDQPEPGSSVLYLRVPEIQQAYEALKSRRVVFSSEPQLIHRDDAGLFGEPGAEEWMAFFSDPDGNALALASRGAGPPAA